MTTVGVYPVWTPSVRIRNIIATAESYPRRSQCSLDCLATQATEGSLKLQGPWGSIENYCTSVDLFTIVISPSQQNH